MDFMLLLLLSLLGISAAAEEPLKQPVVCPYDVSTNFSMNLEAFDRQFRNYNEISGLTISPFQKAPSGAPVMYGVNDSGGGKLIGIFDSGTGERLLTISFRRFQFKISDPESLTIGSCGSTGVNESCLYVGDVGDNKAREQPQGTKSQRNDIPYFIIKIREPIVTEYRDYAEIPLEDISGMYFFYNHSSSPTQYADSEAIFMDHASWVDPGTIYVLSKWNPGRMSNLYTRIFEIPASAWAPVMNGSMAYYSPEAVGTGAGHLGHMWTRADMTRDGTVLAFGTISDIYLFLRCPGESVAEAVNKSSCNTWKSPYSDIMKQFETFAWTPDGSFGLQMSECGGGCNPPMVYTAMSYSLTEQLVVGNTTSRAQPNASELVCPMVGWSDTSPYTCRVLEDNSVKPDLWCTALNLEKPQPTQGPTAAPTMVATSFPTAVETTVPSPSIPVNVDTSGPTTLEEATTASPTPVTNTQSSTSGAKEHLVWALKNQVFLLVAGLFLFH